MPCGTFYEVRFLNIKNMVLFSTLNVFETELSEKVSVTILLNSNGSSGNKKSKINTRYFTLNQYPPSPPPHVESLLICVFFLAPRDQPATLHTSRLPCTPAGYPAYQPAFKPVVQP
jgi:hypothetical protein